MPTVFDLEETTGVDKEIKEEDLELIPLKLRFTAALRRIAFCKDPHQTQRSHRPPPNASNYASP
jgi:hypothetical protein